MSILGTLRIGASGLSAHAFGASVSSNNISNVGTEGYVRRLASLEQLGPPPQSGAGVRAVGSSRVIDPLLFRRILGSTSQQAFADGRSNTLSVLDEVFSEGPSSILESIDHWESAISEFANTPEDLSVRQQMLYESENLAARFRSSSASISEAISHNSIRITDDVGVINSSLQEISKINAKISQLEATGQQAVQLRDQRDMLVKGLAESIPVTTVDQADGTMSVLLGGGVSLVSAEGVYNQLSAIPNANGAVRLSVLQAGASVDITDTITSGKIGGHLQAQTDLGGMLDSLDQLAFDVATSYNAVHQTGFGLDGTGGRNLFEPPVTIANASANFSVSADVSGNPQALAASSDSTAVPGDNRNALALVDLASTTIANGGTQTINEAFSTITSEAGSLMRDAQLDLDFADGVMSQLSTLEQSISGVSIDEEMVNLTQFQRAYEASLQVVRTADEMLTNLINMKR